MKIRNYFTTNHIIEGLIIAILLSAFIYIEHFKLLLEYNLLAINTFSAVLGLYLLLKAKVPVWFFSGFFISIFWLWWLAVSFIYYHLPYLVPVVILAIGVIYGLLFLTLAYIAKKIALKIESYFFAIYWENSRILLNAFVIILINQFEPFGFNWLKLQLIFTDSLFGVELIYFIGIVATIALFSVSKKYYILLLLLLAVNLKTPKIYTNSALRDIELTSTDINVQEKWKPKNRELYTKIALKAIDKAITKNKKLILLPESILPYFLNLEHPYLDQFLERSKKITIVVGALYFKGQNNFRNSAYIIKDGNYTVANKVVLVPFGEANPLPKWMGSIVNKIFFDGAVDYKADSNFTTIKALNKEFKIAICYEGTSKLTYQDYPNYVIVISNNGWFKPSIEPTLQKIMLKYYARVYKSTIYHSINGSKSYVVLPFPEDT